MYLDIGHGSSKWNVFHATYELQWWYSCVMNILTRVNLAVTGCVCLLVEKKWDQSTNAPSNFRFILKNKTINFTSHYIEKIFCFVLQNGMGLLFIPIIDNDNDTMIVMMIWYCYLRCCCWFCWCNDDNDENKIQSSKQYRKNSFWPEPLQTYLLLMLI